LIKTSTNTEQIHKTVQSWAQTYKPYHDRFQYKRYNVTLTEEVRLDETNGEIIAQLKNTGKEFAENEMQASIRRYLPE